MSLPKKIHSLEGPVRAVYENGVLRPLRPLRLREQSRVLITLYPEPKWRAQFDAVLRRMRVRTQAVPQAIIEDEVTRARAEVNKSVRGQA